MGFKIFVVTLLFSATVVAPGPAYSQAVDNPAGAVEPASAPESESKPQSLGGMVVSGGTMNLLFFAILGVFSLRAAAVVLERFFNLREEKVLPVSFCKQLAQLIATPQSTIQPYQALCEIYNAPVSRVFKAGVMRVGRPLPEVEKAMEDAAAREMAAIRAKLRPLNVVGNVAPLIGLLGTVVGMIMAFQVSSQEGLGKAERLAEGIYLALMTTAAGLTIAIPCLLFASWFAGRAERYFCEIGECLSAVMPSLARMEGETFDLSTQQAPLTVVRDRELTPRERFLREAGIELNG